MAEILKVSLDDCPTGLFWFGETLGFKSEYSRPKAEGDLIVGAQCDAYVVGSGEYFWGGTSDWRARAKLMVTPLDLDAQTADFWLNSLASPNSMTRKAPPMTETQDGPTYPETLTPALREVLGTMCFQCIGIAAALRASGEDIERRAEDEQAAVLHYLTRFALSHGDQWRTVAIADLEERKARAVLSPLPSFDDQAGAPSVTAEE
ncbi:hypothetical protein [Hyphomicrobium sp. ghe19]|uniref:hypothetical protein n=1 Tax=Hyphomicrobium sp. ghe19 TaxID=2682968 RepID=UPI0013679952|nr:hypothetical protein HYPP_03808 [Hyphomicrobium sp. ghe19]